MLRVNIAFHSPLTESIKHDFLAAQTGILLPFSFELFIFFHLLYSLTSSETSVGVPSVPFFSTVTGERHNGKFDPQYWWSNIRQPVFFQQGISKLVSTLVSEHSTKYLLDHLYSESLFIF